MKVYIPTPLRSYTGNLGEVDVSGSTVGDVLAALDGQFPGLRFRIISEQDTIRDHIKIFINEQPAEALTTDVHSTDEIHIICALSGG